MARGSWLGDAIAGGIAGGAATWLMDQATSSLLAAQPKSVTDREEAVQPHGRSAVENMVAAADDQLGLGMDKQARTQAASVAHYALGVVPGAVYGVLRRRVPVIGAANGLLFGTLLWAVNDEYLNSALGFAAPADAYPTQTHWRGFIGHAVLGMTTDAGLSVLRR